MNSAKFTTYIEKYNVSEYTVAGAFTISLYWLFINVHLRTTFSILFTLVALLTYCILLVPFK